MRLETPIEVNSFGIGREANAQFCQDLARLGNGICTIVKDMEVGNLQSMVTNAL